MENKWKMEIKKAMTAFEIIKDIIVKNPEKK